MLSIHSYALRDTFGILASIPPFTVFLLAPGYCFGMATDVIRFRSWSITEKLLLSLPISVVISTALANIGGRYLPANVLLWVFLFSAGWALIHLTRQFILWTRLSPRRLPSTTKIVIALAFLWAIVVTASLIDLQFGSKLYASTAIWDHAVRVAFLRSALRSGPPPSNPFCYLGFAPPARYYYYWYVLCSYPARLSHIDARYILYGSSVWAGLCLAALIPLYFKHFMGETIRLRRRSVLGILLLGMTGLDILPTVYLFRGTRFLGADMEWWNQVQITSWVDALLWVPHHVASLVACFIGLLALWSVRRGGAPQPAKARIVAGCFAALSFAAASGLSVYVTFTFAVFLCCWAIRLLSKREISDFLLYLGTGICTVIISVPYLHDLLGSGSPLDSNLISSSGPSPRSSAKFLQFGLRKLPRFLSEPYFLRIRGLSHPHLLYPIGLIALYVLELGFFALVGWYRFRGDIFRRSSLKESEIASWYVVACSLLVITFIRSSVISSNDLGFRGAMLMQFVLLLWGAEYLDEWLFVPRDVIARLRNAKNALTAVTLVLGLAGTVYGICILRIYSILLDRGSITQSVDWLPKPPRIGRDLFETREAYGELDRQAAPRSIVQYNPMATTYISLLMYSRYQSVDAFPDCGTDFGGDAGRCPPVQNAIAKLFNNPGTYDIDQICRNLSINYLVARESDPAWRDRRGWVWSHEPIVANKYIRIFRCR